MEEKIIIVLNEMSEYLSIAQMKKVCSRKLTTLIFQGFSNFQNYSSTSTFYSHFVTFSSAHIVISQKNSNFFC